MAKLKRSIPSLLLVLVFSGCASDPVPVTQEAVTTVPTPEPVLETTTTVAQTSSSTAPTTRTVDVDELVGVGDPLERTGLWSSYETDRQAALEYIADPLPGELTQALTGSVGIRYSIDPSRDFVDRATEVVGILIDEGYELQYSRCWIDREEGEILEFVFDSGNNYWAWLSWEPRDEEGGMGIWPVEISNEDFDPLRNSQEDLIEFVESGRYQPFGVGVQDPNCDPLLPEPS